MVIQKTEFGNCRLRYGRHKGKPKLSDDCKRRYVCFVVSADQQEVEKHLAEAAQLRANIAERDRLIAEKEKEAAARVESVKSQAIFAVCFVMW